MWGIDSVFYKFESRQDSQRVGRLYANIKKKRNIRDVRHKKRNDESFRSKMKNSVITSKVLRRKMCPPVLDVSLRVSVMQHGCESGNQVVHIEVLQEVSVLSAVCPHNV